MPGPSNHRRMGSRHHAHEEDDDLEYEARKFRICIIGRAGVGKSTLLGQVFGMTPEQARVKHKGDAIIDGGGVHNIWDEIRDENRNHSLIIHDSRGFEASETQSVTTVKEFIHHRSRKNHLSEQLHCIWYCLSLAEDRPLQQQERDLFKFIHDRGIPIVFVLTKYDRLVSHNVNDIARDEERPTADEWIRARRAAQDYIEAFRGQIQNTVGQVVKVQEVSNKRKDSQLIQKLVVDTTQVIRPNLRHAWMRAQGVLATQKRDSCIKDFPRKKLRTFINECSIPLNPFKAVVLDNYFDRVFSHCMAVWNLPGQSALFTASFIKQQFRDTIQRFLPAVELAATLDIFGPVTLPLYVNLAIKMTCDLIMIFQQLFWATPRRYILTQQDLETQLGLYQRSMVRQTIHTQVDGCLSGVDYWTALSTERVLKTIHSVVKVGQQIVADELRTTQDMDVDEITMAELPG